MLLILMIIRVNCKAKKSLKKIKSKKFQESCCLTMKPLLFVAALSAVALQAAAVTIDDVNSTNKASKILN
jgi:hypothetical protein